MNDSDNKRNSFIKIAGWIALIGNLILAAIKISVGVTSKSLAVVGDGIDSSTDVIIAFVALIISTIISRPSDKGHPWGHGRAETTATMLLSFIIFFAGAQLAFSAISQLISGNQTTPPNILAIIVTIISIVGKSLLAWSQYYLGKKAGSMIILANAQNMRNDIVISISVLVGVATSLLFKLPLLDSITAIAVSIWVMKNAIKLFFELNTELMDGNTDNTLYTKLFESINLVKGASNPHRARIRKIASRWDIDVDIEVDENLTVHDAHHITEQVEQSIRQSIPDVYDIMVHIEPAGHAKHHPKEQFGLSEKDIQEEH